LLLSVHGILSGRLSLRAAFDVWTFGHKLHLLGLLQNCCACKLYTASSSALVTCGRRSSAKWAPRLTPVLCRQQEQEEGNHALLLAQAPKVYGGFNHLQEDFVLFYRRSVLANPNPKRQKLQADLLRALCCDA
jgi:hypothetical protein